MRESCHSEAGAETGEGLSQETGTEWVTERNRDREGAGRERARERERDRDRERGSDQGRSR